MLKLPFTSKKKNPSPLSCILASKESSIQLHSFLLKNWDKKTDTIEAAGEEFEVGIISINPAPIMDSSKNSKSQ